MKGYDDVVCWYDDEGVGSLHEEIDEVVSVLLAA